jgi:hypothetical protein
MPGNEGVREHNKDRSIPRIMAYRRSAGFNKSRYGRIDNSSGSIRRVRKEKEMMQYAKWTPDRIGMNDCREFVKSNAQNRYCFEDVK